MLGLPRKSDRPVALIAKENDRENTRLNRMNSRRGGLRLTMVGPHMMLIPQPEYDSVIDSTTPLPAAD